MRGRANQPNVFSDPKSSESALPHFSDGSRADEEQRAFLEAHHTYWRSGAAANPVSGSYGGPMVDTDRIYLWAWDARPYPAFPLNRELWADGDNWLAGHWLNGRLGTAPVRELLGIWAQNGSGVSLLENVSSPSLTGMVVAGPVSAREVIEPVLAMHAMSASDTGSDVVLDVYSGEGYAPTVLPKHDCAEMSASPALEITRMAEGELPREIVVTYRDGLRSYASATAYSRRMDGEGLRQVVIDLPAVLDPQTAKTSADRILAMHWAGRAVAKFSLPLAYADLEPGMVVAFDDEPARHWMIERLTLASQVEIEARSIAKPPENAVAPLLPGKTRSNADGGLFGGPPEMVFADLPLLSGASEAPVLHVGLYAYPETPLLIFSSPENSDYQLRQTVRGNATIGYLAADFDAGPVGRMDGANTITVTMRNGSFSSTSDLQVFAGANRIAVRAMTGAWEVIQFQTATEIAAGTWELSGLLRGQYGTEDATEAGCAAGAPLIVLDEHLATVTLEPDEAGLDLYYRAGPGGKEFSERYFATAVASGGVRAQRPLAPVHLRAKRDATGGLALTWIRRSRIGADSWTPGDIPLGEEAEAYVVRLFAGGAVQGEWQVSAPIFEMDAPLVQQLLGTGPSDVEFEVAQMSASAGAGIAARSTVTIQ